MKALKKVKAYNIGTNEMTYAIHDLLELHKKTFVVEKGSKVSITSEMSGEGDDEKIIITIEKKPDEQNSNRTIGQIMVDEVKSQIRKTKGA